MWYQQHARVLPWRESGDPYHIWVSEVMLQQTRVNAVQAPSPVAGLPMVMPQYIYDAEGRRVAKGTISNWSCNTDTNGFVQTTAYVDGPDGGQMTEMSVATNETMTWVHTNVTAGGKLIATYQNDNGGASPEAGKLHFALNNWLGTKRMQTTYDGSFDNSWVSLPFGEVPPAPPGGSYAAPDATEQHFTGKERDAESGLDLMGARYYASTMGRFMSPDPVFASAARVIDPQQWNMYAYARNNPLSITDPTGLDFNLKCSGGDSLTCQNGVQGQTLLAEGGGTRFEATVVSGSADSGYKDQFGGQYSGTFDEKNGVSFMNTASGDVSSHSQFIEGSNATSVNGSGAFAGITGNFFNACGGSCEARGTLTGTADAFTSMKSQLVQSSAFKSFLDGLSMAHPLISQQWKDANGYAHLIKAPGDIMDMHFEGASTGAGLQAFILHSVSTIKDIATGNAFRQRGMMTPGKDSDEQ